MIQLRQFDAGDYELLISWVDSKDALMQFAGPGFTFPLTKEQLDKSLSDPNRFAFAVMDANSNIAIGYAEVYLTVQSAYLGRILIGDKELRVQGRGKEIVTLILDFVFLKTDKWLAELNVFDWNETAIRCYERVGFTINPDKRLERKVNGQIWTALNMTLDKTQWALSAKTQG